MSQGAKSALIAVGSNVTSPAGPPLILAKKGIEAVAEAGWRVLAVSRFFLTPAFPEGSGDDYVNAAFAVEAAAGRGPEDLMADLHAVESAFGRERRDRWGSRPLDLDLLAWGDTVAPDPGTLQHWMDLPLEVQRSAAPDRLILPHPRLQDRSFVLVPLADVAPDWVHPVLGRTVTAMLAARPGEERAAVRVLE